MPDLALPPRQVHTITDRFSMTNTFLIEDDSLIVVDPYTRLHAELLLAYVQRFLKRQTTSIELIVLTRPLPEFIPALEVLLQDCSAAIATSATFRPPLHSPQTRRISRFPHMAEPLHEFFSPALEYLLQRVTMWLDIPSGSLDTCTLPHHSSWCVIPASSPAFDRFCLYNASSRELLSGDLLSFSENGLPLLRTGFFRRETEELRRLLRSLDIAYLYPGHGRPILGHSSLARISLE